MRLSLCLFVVAGLVTSLFPNGRSQAEEIRLERVTVEYTDVDRSYAEAIARTVQAARDICAETYLFDMPPQIDVRINLDKRRRPRLFNDGVNQFSLTIRSVRDLRIPTQSGIFHLYGMCHEVAHLGMYRPITRHDWMTTAAAEGWAHYLGSRLVDDLYEREGEELWPDRYDYRRDGMARLEKQLAAEKLSPTAQGARLWRELAEILGDEKIPVLFAAWGKADIDPTDPAAALGPELLALSDDARLADWWSRAESVFVLRQETSGFAAQNSERGDLTGAPRELAHDDNESTSKKSLAGGGHAVRFERPAGQWFLTEVSLFGSRYGSPRPPREDFHVWLCDEENKVIAEFSFPYSEFKRGEPQWVSLPVKPTTVPAKFIICVGFNPSARKGVFVHYDQESSGHSLSGLPGRPPRPYQGGDWMIRTRIDQQKSADALGAEK